MKALFWHRRDLRLHDNAGLYKALKNNQEVQPVFIFDTNILQQLPQHDQRVIFIHQAVANLKKTYQQLGSDLLVLHGDPSKLIPETADATGVDHVYTNRDYEPYASERDHQIYTRLNENGISFTGAKDQVIFEKNEIVKADGTPYTIFTPYSRKWKEKLNDFYLSSYPVENYTNRLKQVAPTHLISLEELGFSSVQTETFPSEKVNDTVLKNYTQQRDYPGINGTSKLSVHLRFGTISIRELARKAVQTNETFLNELIWRDFYAMILFHFPYSAKNSFKKAYDAIRWENDEQLFEHWKNGTTGYPLVDAGMRELNQTGFMHNRVRMVVSSFLTKHLLIDWRWGEAYFAEKLLDFDLASNVGGWQWAAGCGCDAAPYFRVFNPAAQQEKFDKQLIYIKKWVPEFGTATYPKPIIDHAFARERVLVRFKEALDKN